MPETIVQPGSRTRRSVAAVAEPGLDDVVEQRPDRVADADGDVYLVPTLELAQPQQHLFRRGAPPWQRQLVAAPRRLRVELDRETADKAHRQASVDLEAILAAVVQIL